jgi:parallel beta-helix repeat protein
MVVELKKAFLLAFVLVSLSVSILGTGLIITVSGLTTHHVYPGESIQVAINSAYPGDTIFVHAGTYHEEVTINKNDLVLLGEDKATVIDGEGMITPVFWITANNVTVKGFTIRDGGRIYGLFGGGIYMTGSNCTVVDNVIENTQYGINLNGSARNIIAGNSFTANDVGIQFLDGQSNNSAICHNNFINNSWHQVHSFAVSHNTWDNGFEGTYWSDYVTRYPNATEIDGSGIWDTPYVINEDNQDNYPLIQLYSSIRNLDTNLTYLTIQSAIDAPETLDGHTIFVEEGIYCENLVVNKSLSLIGKDRDSTIIHGNNSAHLVNVEASNAKITGFTMQGFSFANIYISGATGVTIKGNRILFIGAGIDLHNSNNSVITSNIIEGHGLDNIGIIVVESSGCIIENNTISGAVYDGIRLIWSADNNIITSNTISNNDYGIHIIHSNINTIINNTIVDNSKGIFMERGNGNTVIGNTLSDNWAAISFSFSSYDNVIHHNNFFNNTHQIGNPLHSDPLSSNRWDDDLEGNYWSDYTGQDANLDGIGDTPYIADGDNYPLMGIFSDFTVWTMKYTT